MTATKLCRAATEAVKRPHTSKNYSRLANPTGQAGVSRDYGVEWEMTTMMQQQQATDDVAEERRRMW